MVLLIGNYPADQQQSMLRFAKMMEQGLTSAGIPVVLINPRSVFGRLTALGSLVQKWLGYIDKYFLFPFELRRKVLHSSVVHICDHSNAVYTSHISSRPVLVTCHDLLAVRGALGEETDCPASRTGAYLQRWILRCLTRATAIACVSRATLRDAERLIPRRDSRPRFELVPNGLNYPFRKLPVALTQARLASINDLLVDRPFILHVGSNLRRKNREGLLRIFALTKNHWSGRLVVAGSPLSEPLHSLARELGISNRIVEVADPDSGLLEALYNHAVALVYPSRFEGFGWPIIEAQACGCPVICSDQEPLPEVAGEAALIHPLADEQGFADDILRLCDDTAQEEWRQKSLRNAEQFSAEKMVSHYVSLYQEMGAIL